MEDPKDILKAVLDEYPDLKNGLPTYEKSPDTVAMEYLKSLETKMISIYDSSVKPLPLKDDVKLVIQDAFGLIMEAAIARAHEPGGLYKFHNEDLEGLISRVGIFVKKLKVGILNEAADQLSQIPFKEVSLGLNELHYKLKRKKSDEEFIGESSETSISYYLEYVKDLKDYIETIRAKYDLERKEASKNDELADEYGLVNNFQRALYQWYLETYEAHSTLIGKEIVDKYGAKRVEVFLGEIRKYYREHKKLNIERKDFKKDLENVSIALSGFPIAKKAITNNLSELD